MSRRRSWNSTRRARVDCESPRASRRVRVASSASGGGGTRFPDFRRRTEISRDSNVSTRERARFASCRRSFAASVRSARWISPGTKSTPRRRREARRSSERLDLRVNPIASLPAEFARLRERLGAKHAMWSPNVTIRAPIVTGDALRALRVAVPALAERWVEFADPRRGAACRREKTGASSNSTSPTLPDEALRGRAPEEIGTLTALKTLRLRKESSRGVVPRDRGLALTELETLDASENALACVSGGVAARARRARRRRLEKQTHRVARVGSPAQNRTFGRVREQVGARAVRGFGSGSDAARLEDDHPSGRNRLAEVPASLADAPRLTTIDVSANALTALPDALGRGVGYDTSTRGKIRFAGSRRRRRRARSRG